MARWAQTERLSPSAAVDRGSERRQPTASHAGKDRPAEMRQLVDEVWFDKFNTNRQNVDRLPPPDHPAPRRRALAGGVSVGKVQRGSCFDCHPLAHHLRGFGSPRLAGRLRGPVRSPLAGPASISVTCTLRGLPALPGRHRYRIHRHRHRIHRHCQRIRRHRQRVHRHYQRIHRHCHNHFARPASLARHRQRIHRRGNDLLPRAAPRTRRLARQRLGGPAPLLRIAQFHAQLLPPDPFGRHFHSQRLHSVRGSVSHAPTRRAEAPHTPLRQPLRSCASLLRRSRFVACASVSARSARSRRNRLRPDRLPRRFMRKLVRGRRRHASHRLQAYCGLPHHQ